MTDDSAGIACLILAAGQGRRFGGNKMLHRLPDGPRMIEATVQRYSPLFESVYVVVPAGDHAVRQALSGYRAHFVEVDNPQQGMSRSLVSGVRALSPDRGWLIALGDMPYVATQAIHALCQVLTADNIVQPLHQGHPGNPVAFGVTFRSELEALSGDVGGKSILQSHPDQLLQVEVGDPGVLQDIDTPEALS